MKIKVKPEDKARIISVAVILIIILGLYFFGEGRQPITAFDLAKEALP